MEIARNKRQPRMLEYPSLLIVLSHMEANIRFQLALRCPSVRNAEKLAPLKCDVIRFDRTTINVNKTAYDLNVVLTFPDGDMPERYHLLDEKEGGYKTDIDAEGRRDWSTHENILFPGDIRIGKTRAFLVNNNSEPIVEKFIATVDLYIQSKGEVELERVEYEDKCFFKAHKTLIEFFFGSRGATIHTKMFYYDGTILRLPVGAIFKTHQLKSEANPKYLKNVLPIIDPSSFPLELLSIWSFENGLKKVKRHEVVTNAKKLKLFQLGTESDTFIRIISELPNKQIFAEMIDKKLDTDDYCLLIRSLKRKEKPIGFCCTFLTLEPRYVPRTFENVKQKYATKNNQKNNFMVNIDTSKAISISFGFEDVDENPDKKFDDYKDTFFEDEDEFSDDKKETFCFVRLEVVSTDPLDENKLKHHQVGKRHLELPHATTSSPSAKKCKIGQELFQESIQSNNRASSSNASPTLSPATINCVELAKSVAKLSRHFKSEEWLEKSKMQITKLSSSTNHTFETEELIYGLGLLIHRVNNTKIETSQEGSILVKTFFIQIQKHIITELVEKFSDTKLNVISREIEKIEGQEEEAEIEGGSAETFWVPQTTINATLKQFLQYTALFD